MPVAGTCKVCEHPDRGAIEASVAAGVPSLQVIADRSGLAKTSLIRHRDAHMAGPRTSAVEAVRTKQTALAPVQLQRATVALSRLAAEQAVHDATDTQVLARQLFDVTFGEPDENGVRRPLDPEVSIKALGKLIDANGGGKRQAAETLGKLDGSIKTGSQTLVLVEGGRVVHPELARVMDTVMGALAPYPDAGAAVQRALEEMAGEAGGAR